MAKKRFGDILRKLVYAKIGITTFLVAFYIGAKNHTIVNRLEDSLMYRNVPAARNSFKDPAGLEIVTEINGKGEKEVYLVHESGKKIAIGYDMLPKEPEDLVRGLESRMYNTKYETRTTSYVENCTRR